MFKFYLNNEEFTPINIGDLSLDIELVTNKGAYHFERVLNGAPLFAGEAYSFIMSHSDGQSIKFKIEEACSKGIFTVYNGSFTNWDCEPDKDKKQIKCEIEPNSLYRRLVSNYDKTFNFLETPNIVSVEYEKTSVYEYRVEALGTVNPPVRPLWGEYVQVQGGGSPFLAFALYVRERKTVYCIGGELTKPAGDRWELLIDNCATKNLATWVRKPEVFVNPLLNNFDFADTTIATPGTPPPPAPSPGRDWILMSTLTFGAVTISFWVDFNAIRQDIKTLINGRNLVDVVNYGLNKDVPELDVQSNFLTDDINPVNGESPSTTKGIQMHAISDIKNLDNTEKARKQDVRLADILEGYFEGKLNCWWRVDENTKRLIIENYKDLFSQGVIDVSDSQLIKKYSYDKSRIPRAEEFPSLDSSVDYTGVPIEYDNNIGKGVNTYNTDRFYSEVESIIEDPEEYSSKGIVMITPDSLRPNGVLAENGAITNTYLPNMPQSLSVLHKKFFPYYRPFGSGILNFNNSAFNNTNPVKKAEPIIIDVCCIALFDPYSRFIGKTFANGFLKSANYKFSTKKITLNIQYNE